MAKTKQSVRGRNRPPQPAARDDRSARRVLGIIGGVVIVVALVYVGWSTANDPERRIAERTAELQEQQTARDREQITDLTEQARAVAGELTPVLEGMVEAMPPGGEPGPVAEADTVAGWQEVAGAAVARFEDPPSGSTGTNVARNSIAVAAGAFDSAADTYAVALEADGDLRDALLVQAAAQRDLAVRSWSIGATQLDEINIQAGFGHQHVYLKAEGTGALTPDGAAEGDEAHTGD